MSLSLSIKYEMNYRYNTWLSGIVVVAVFGDAESDGGDWPYKLGGLLAI